MPLPSLPMPSPTTFDGLTAAISSMLDQLAPIKIGVQIEPSKGSPLRLPSMSSSAASMYRALNRASYCSDMLDLSLGFIWPRPVRQLIAVHLLIRMIDRCWRRPPPDAGA